MTNQKRGLSLVEILVVVSIITIIMSVTLFSYRSFTDRLAVSGASQEVSVAVRQAQTYGVSVKGTMSGSFGYAYGVFFDTTDPHAYYLFVDKNANGKYDGNTNCAQSAECVEKITLHDEVSISQICAKSLGATTFTCPPQSATQLNILYMRPKLQAIINFSNSFGTVWGPYQTASLTLTSPRQAVSRVTFESNGQISTQ